MKIAKLLEQRKVGRKIQGIAAALLPFESGGQVAVEPFQRHLIATHRAGLMNAVNMDTGYVNFLSDAEKKNVLRWTTQALGKGVPFVAGAYIETREGEIVDLYRKEMDIIAGFGGIPILFQTARLHGKPAKGKIATYQAACRGYAHVLGFELGNMFASNGEIFDQETLDRLMELERIALRDALRPDFRIYTGNDLGINMIEYGADYLLGLATLAPEKFAERDRLWQAGDPAYYALSDALQHLGNIAFRDPIPAYKHSAAVFLHLIGRIPSSTTHPRNPKRPPWEAEILRDCALRLGFDRQEVSRAL
jgi:4-hydroxy-tetrahydrodipicolinate synthase